jgi:hypothetical protein
LLELLELCCGLWIGYPYFFPVLDGGINAVLLWANNSISWESCKLHSH